MMDARNNIYAIFAAATIMLAASCDKVPAPEKNGAIRFSALSTKALVNDIEPLKAGIGVYDFETPASGDADVTTFNNVTLSYTAGAWSYSPVQYWTPRSEYYFFGLYPAAARTIDSAAHTITIQDFTCSYSYGAQTDLMAGCGYRNYAKLSDATTVELAMRHILSAVEFKVRNSSSDVVSISNVVLTGVYGTGSCVLTPVEKSSDFTVSWVPNTSSSMTCNGDATVSNISAGLTTYGLFKEAILFIPQEIDRDSITLSFRATLTSDSTYSDKTLPLTMATNITEWLPGKKYTYVATYTDNNITFSLEVADWDTYKNADGTDEEIEL